MPRRLQVLLAVFACLAVAMPVSTLGAGTQSDRPPADLTQQEAQADDSNATLYSPPNVSRYNEGYLESYTTGGPNYSARPSHVTWSECCELSTDANGSSRQLFSEAYVEIFSVTPSTIVHTQSGTQRYGSANGTVRVVSNYRLNKPGSDSKSLTRNTSEIELLVNGSVVDTSSSATPRLQYREVSGPANLTVRLTLEGAVTSANASEPETYSMVLSDTETIRIQNLTGLDVNRGYGWVNDTGLGPNESVIAMSVPGQWSRVSFDGGPTANSRWRYDTRSNENWTDWQTSSESPEGAGSNFTEIAPTEVHAVQTASAPELTQPFINQSNRSATNDYRSAWLEQPDSNQALRDGGEENLGSGDWFTLRSSHSLQHLDEFAVYGLVRGRSTNRSLDTERPPTARELNLTARTISSSDERTRLLIHPDQKVGGFVAQGQIVVETRESRVERQLELTDWGEVVVTLPQATVRRADITYTPERPWWRQSRLHPVVATEATYVHTPGLPSLTVIIDFMVVTVLAFVPLGLLLYGFDVVSRGKLLNWYKP